MAATLARVELKDVKQEHSRFLINQKDFSKQYSHIYDHRSKQMREGLSDLVKRQWGAEFPIAAKIIDTESIADEYKNAEVALVGILYKEMGLRASVLDEFKEHGGISQGITEKIDNYMSEVCYRSELKLALIVSPIMLHLTIIKHFHTFPCSIRTTF